MAQEPIALDTLDYRILDALQQDVTQPINELAERLGSSKSVVWRRMQRLLELKVIRERVAVLDAEKLGYQVLVFAQVKMARHGTDTLPRFVESIRRFPQVIECHSLMGSVDFLLKILVRDVKDYEQFFWNQLSKLDGVQEISSSISMTQFVSSRRIALP